MGLLLPPGVASYPPCCQMGNHTLARQLEQLQDVERLQLQKLAADETNMNRLHSALVHERGFTSEMLSELARQADAHAQSVL